MTGDVMPDKRRAKTKSAKPAEGAQQPKWKQPPPRRLTDWLVCTLLRLRGGGCFHFGCCAPSAGLADLVLARRLSGITSPVILLALAHACRVTGLCIETRVT